MIIDRIYLAALLGLAMTSGLLDANTVPAARSSAGASERVTPPPAPRPLAGVFRSEEGGFSITLPDGFSDPEESVEPMETEGGNVDLMMFTSGSGNTAAMFAYANMDGKVTMEGNEKVMLDGARDNMLKSMKATLTKQQKITIDGYPGQRLLFSMKPPGSVKFYARLEMYLVSPFMYQVMYVSDKRSSVESKAINNFFKSFTLERAAG